VFRHIFHTHDVAKRCYKINSAVAFLYVSQTNFASYSCSSMFHIGLLYRIEWECLISVHHTASTPLPWKRALYAPPVDSFVRYSQTFVCLMSVRMPFYNLLCGRYEIRESSVTYVVIVVAGRLCLCGYGAVVERYWQRKTEELGEKPVPVSLCPPYIPHALTWARIRAPGV
jgi:hypothetical protein